MSKLSKTLASEQIRSRQAHEHAKSEVSNFQEYFRHVQEASNIPEANNALSKLPHIFFFLKEIPGSGHSWTLRS